MSDQMHKWHEFIGDIRFRVPRRRFSDIPLGPIFLKGYGLTVLFILGIRCMFFIDAAFANGEVINFTVRKAGRQVSIIPMVAFTTKEGRMMRINAKRDLYLKVGDRVRVIYKKDNPAKALVYNYRGFWANATVLCGIALLFWIGFPLAYFGFDD